jgi:hypothetical protein
MAATTGVEQAVKALGKLKIKKCTADWKIRE